VSRIAGSPAWGLSAALSLTVGSFERTSGERWSHSGRRSVLRQVVPFSALGARWPRAVDSDRAHRRLVDDRLGLGTAYRASLIERLAWQRQVGETIAVHVAHLPATVAVLGAAETMRSSFDARPGRDHVPDQLTSPLHSSALDAAGSMSASPLILASSRSAPVS